MSPKKELKYPGYISLRLEEELRKRLAELAEAEDRSIGYIARSLIREGLAGRDRKTARKKKPS